MEVGRANADPAENLAGQRRHCGAGLRHADAWPMDDRYDLHGPCIRLREDAELIIDNAAYFRAARTALLSARRQVWLLGWQFEPQTRLRPDVDDETLGSLLKRIAAERPELSVRVLIWRAALPIALSERGMPHLALPYFRRTNVNFCLDASHPFGASEHQKLLVVDDDVAFCTGADFVSNRWDRWTHPDQDPARETSWGRATPARHSATMRLRGAAAVQLGAVARRRWERAVGEKVSAVRAGSGPSLAESSTRILRTEPPFGGVPEVREAEEHCLEAIRSAKRTIYLENQYFSSATVARALAERLAERAGPDVLLITGGRAPSLFDRLTMDPPRNMIVGWLRGQDPHGRLGIYAPETDGGAEVLVHSKMLITDDRIRVGSANLSNRSFGYDSECDVSVEGLPAGQTTDILCRLIAHFVRKPAAEVASLEAAEGGRLSKVVARLTDEARGLRPLQVDRPNFLRRVIATFHLGDPFGVDDAWQPWRRVPLPKHFQAES